MRVRVKAIMLPKVGSLLNKINKNAPKSGDLLKPGPHPAGMADRKLLFR